MYLPRSAGGNTYETIRDQRDIDGRQDGDYPVMDRFERFIERHRQSGPEFIGRKPSFMPESERYFGSCHGDFTAPDLPAIERNDRRRMSYAASSQADAMHRQADALESIRDLLAGYSVYPRRMELKCAECLKVIDWRHTFTFNDGMWAPGAGPINQAFHAGCFSHGNGKYFYRSCCDQSKRLEQAMTYCLCDYPTCQSARFRGRESMPNILAMMLNIISCCGGDQSSLMDLLQRSLPSLDASKRGHDEAR